MKYRTIKDIRIYESDTQNGNGNGLPKQLGTLFLPSNETVFIAQRIARKLNEYQVSFGAFDHIYINLTTVLCEGKIEVSGRKVDERIRYVDVGLELERVKSLSDTEKDSFITETIFRVLKQLCSIENLALLEMVEKLINEWGSEITIHYKRKETIGYTIDIYYQISSASNGTQAIIEYTNRRNNTHFSVNYKLHFYEDIYFLIDTVQVINGKIIMKPKRTFIASMNNQNYRIPIELKLHGHEKK